MDRTQTGTHLGGTWTEKMDRDIERDGVTDSTWTQAGTQTWTRTWTRTGGDGHGKLSSDKL
jgi:hypothetical protein